MVKIGLPCWIATTRRVVNDTPSRTRSTWYTIGCRGLPGRRKYACSECTRRSLGTVRPAAIRACAATCPPNTLTGEISGETPRYRLSSMRSRSSNATSASTTPCPRGTPSISSSTAAVSSVTSVCVTQPVHPDEVGGARGVGRSPRHDDHDVTRFVAGDLQHGQVDLLDHGVGGVHGWGDEGPHPPGERQLVPNRFTRGEGQDGQRSVQPRQP